MNKKLLLIIFGGLFFFNVFAQSSWRKINSPYGGLVNPLAIDSNNNLYALFNDVLSKSKDQGLNWSPIFTNAFTFTLGLDARIYVETLDGKLYVSADWGTTWVPLPQTINNLKLEKMAIAQDGTLYFAEGNDLYVSKDRGQQWAPVAFQFHGDAMQVRVNRLNQIYVFGNNRLYYAEQNPSSFTLILEAENTIRTVFDTVKGDLFAAIGSENSGVVSKSSNQGKSWTRTNLPYAQSFYQSPQGWLFGAGSTTRYMVPGNSFLSLTNGDTWSPIEIGLPVFAFAVSSEGKIFAGSDGLFVSNNSGATFTNISPQHATVRTILNASQDRLFCITGIDKKFCRFWFSSNDGDSWTEMNRQSVFNRPSTFFDAKIVGDNRLWLLLGYSAEGQTTVFKIVLYESIDGGFTWKAKRELNASQAGFDNDKSLHTGYLWIYGEKYFFKTEDYGVGWIPTTLPFEVGNLHAASEGLIYGYSKTDVNKIRRLYYSFDRGDKWNYVDAPYENTGSAKLCVDRFGHVYKLTAQQKSESDFALLSLLHSADYGQHFTDITPDSGAVLRSSTTMYSMSSDPNGALYLNGAHFISMTRDNGNSWQEVYSSEPQNPEICSLHSAASVDVYAGTISNGILKTENSPLIFTPEIIDDLEMPIAATYGINWVDYDGDGYDDIFLVNDGPNLLYKNNKDGAFKRITTGAIVTDNEPSRSASWADYNNDGFIDCFVANGIKEVYNSLYKNNGDGTFKKITEGNIVEDYGDYRGCAWADVDNDSDLDLYVTEVSEEYPNALYINDGTSHFTKSKDVVIGAPADRTYNCGWCDFDNDGDLDIYLANLGADKLYEQVRPGEFALVGPERLAVNEGSAVSCSWGDYNNDGFMDLFVTNYDSPNCLYRNNGNGSFTKVTTPGIGTDSKISKGSGWADYDNDGDLDLFVSNRDSYLFYTNDGSGNFERTSTAEFIYHGGNSLALAWGDKENDGDLDLIIGSYDQQTLIYKNVTHANNWLKIRCVGNNSSNRSALGAKIFLKTKIDNQMHQQMRHVTAQTGHAAQSSLIQHFGLGKAGKVDSIIVNWPSGKRQVLLNKSANQKITIVEGGTSFVELGENGESQRDYRLASNYPNPFNSTTTIRYDVQTKTLVRIIVYDSNGHQVKTLVNDAKSAGSYTVEWSGENDQGLSVASGLYFYKMTTDDFEQVGKMTLLR